MKKLLLFIFILLGFIAKSQEYDEIYIREWFYLTDSGVNKITSGDTLLTLEEARLLFTDGATTFTGLDDTESSYTAYEFQVANAGATALESPSNLTYNDSLKLSSGNLVVSDTVKVGGRIVVGTSNPLSALHLNKGTGLANGLNLGSTLGNGFSLFGTDAVSGWAGDKEIFRLVENVTEQIIINPAGDFTGTAAAPNWAFGGGGVFNTGVYESSDNVLNFSLGGVNTMILSSGIVQSRDFIPQASNIYELGSPTRLWRELWTSELNNPTSLSIEINEIEAMRLTEDTVFTKIHAEFELGIKSIISGTGWGAWIENSGTGAGSHSGLIITAGEDDGDSPLLVRDQSGASLFRVSGDGTGNFTGDVTLDATLIHGIGTIADNDATPDVSGGNIFLYNGTANSVTITDLDNPVVGATYIIIGNSDTYLISIVDGGNFYLNSSVDLTKDSTITLLCLADNYYIELSRNNIGI